jgi:hypothetical protein
VRSLPAVLLAFALVSVACDSGDSAPTTTTFVPTTFLITTTTLPQDTCDNLTRDAARFLEDLVEQLDETSLGTFTEPERWPRELQELRQQGIALDERLAVLGCDAATVQAGAFDRADVDPDGPLAERLVELLYPEG